MSCTAACFLFFVFCHHDEAAAERGLEALMMCLQAIACCSLQLSGKLLRRQASLCEFLCVSTCYSMMNTCETGRHLQTSWTNCSHQQVLHALLTVHVNQTSSYGTGPVRATCYAAGTATAVTAAAVVGWARKGYLYQ
jgi:hypothetical protein